jgi:hypothetical protein
MRKIKPLHRKRDRYRPNSDHLSPSKLPIALNYIAKHGLNYPGLQIKLRLPTLLEAEKLVFHLQSFHSKKLKKKLKEFRDKEVGFKKIEKWEFVPEKKIQSLEYYLTL